MYRVYGSRISYFTGKLETYLRYRGHEYALLPTYAHARAVVAGTGSTQMPALQLASGRWASDTTPLLAWLDARDARDGAPSIYPTDPALRFVALLVEDYADEWLWRPAMHYRWNYRLDRAHAAALLCDEQMAHIRLPRALKRRVLIRRQRGGFVAGDGVNAQTRAHVEAGYRTALARLEASFAHRRFLLGATPSVADFALMGPMLRHFAQDPTPADIMRHHAPGVYAWVARMWNTRDGASRCGRPDDRARDGASRCGKPDDRARDGGGRDGDGGAVAWLTALDAPLLALLREVCETHLVQLRENARAVALGRRRFSQEIQGVRYENLPASRYRVWCLEALRRAWAKAGDGARERLRAQLVAPGASALWDATPLGSGYDTETRAPFNRARNVFDKDVRA